MAQSTAEDTALTHDLPRFLCSLARTRFPNFRNGEVLADFQQKT